MKHSADLRLFIFALIPLLLAACGAGMSVGTPMEQVMAGTKPGQTYKDVFDAELDSPNYLKHLAKDYRALAMFEYNAMHDYKDAETFAKKSLQARRGEAVSPTKVSERNIDISYREEAESAYNTVLDAYRQKKHIHYPAEMARLQMAYDCWLEQIEENIQPVHIMKCKNHFFEALGKMRGIETTVVVYFENDSFDIIPDEMQKLEAVAANFKVRRESIAIEGHTDTVGTDEYNIDLGAERARIVAQALTALDQDITKFELRSFGERNLAIPTADNISEPRNRRALVHFK